MDDLNTNPDTVDGPSLNGQHLNNEELILAQEAGWQRGNPLPVEAYLAQHPELNGKDDVIIDLLTREIRLRRQYGEQPELQEYRGRFPRYEARLAKQFPFPTSIEAKIDLSTTQPDLSPPDNLVQTPSDVGGYEILKEMGRGGMGIVYKARHRGLNRLGALKMIYPGGRDGEERLARFRGEAEALGRLEHPNIVQIYDIGEHQGRPYLVMEFLTGQSLEDHLQGVPQPARQAAELTETLARAVHYAHQRGIIHRDLKPANVMLPYAAAGIQGRNYDGTKDNTLSEGSTSDPQAVSLFASAGSDGKSQLSTYAPKITDFGLAKLVGSGSGQTRSGAILGTPSYMAPEQARGDHAAVGPLTDLYSLGAILYTLLTGRPPFHAESVWETMNQVECQDPIPPRQFQPRIPGDLETICLKCLQKDPRRRYASVGAFADDLHRYLIGDPIKARPTPVWERAWKWVKRRPTIAAVTATAVLLLGVLVTAHYVHLRAELMKAQSEMTLKEIERALDSIETEINARNWQQARQQQVAAFENLLLPAIATYPTSPGLGELTKRAEGLERSITARLTDQSRLNLFRAYRNDVADLTTPFIGMSAAASHARARVAIDQALALFHTNLRERSLPIADSSTHFTQSERDEVREGCGLMLLELAGSLRASVASSKLEAAHQAEIEEALRLLNRAATLVTTPLIDVGIARCRALLGSGAEKISLPHVEAPSLTRAFEFYLHGCDLSREERWREAIVALEHALEREPDLYAAHRVISICYLKLTQYDTNPTPLLLAREHLNRCIQLRPNQIQPCLERGHVLSSLREFAASDADFNTAEQLLSAHPDEMSLYALLNSRGVSRINQKQLDAAIVDLRRAIALQPTEYAGHVNLARAYQEKNQWHDAAAELDRAIALQPPRMLAALYRSRSRLRQERGDWAGALADALQAKGQLLDDAKSSSAIEDWRRVSQLSLKCDKPADAVKAADAILAIDATDPEAYRLRAEGLLEQKHFQAAEQALNGYFKAAGTSGLLDTWAFRARARARTAIREYKTAAEDYSRVLDQMPNDMAALAGRGWSYLFLEAWKLALDDFERMIKIDKASGDGYNGRGYALVKLGKYREATADADAAVRLGGPQPARTLYNASRIFAQALQQAEADPLEQTPRGKRNREDYEDRALRLLSQSLIELPDGDRGLFWKETVERDAALLPLRRNPRFVKMAESYSGPSS